MDIFAIVNGIKIFCEIVCVNRLKINYFILSLRELRVQLSAKVKG